MNYLEILSKAAFGGRRLSPLLYVVLLFKLRRTMPEPRALEAVQVKIAVRVALEGQDDPLGLPLNKFRVYVPACGS